MRAYRTASGGGISGAGPVRLYFTKPRRYLLHGDNGGLLGRGGQHGTRAALQLPGPLGGYDDEPVSALLSVVRGWCSERCCVGLCPP